MQSQAAKSRLVLDSHKDDCNRFGYRLAVSELHLRLGPFAKKTNLGC